jgi:NADP-dependent 3-hydroxy acid dehydrogenase YdfG
MGFLADKRILITGVLSKHSIAYGIAKACHREGAQLAFTYQNERFETRVAKFAAEFDSSLIYRCDVAEDADIDALFAALAEHWDGLEGLVHSIAYAPGEAIEGDFLDGISRDAFRIAHDVSSYSYAALAKAARPLLLKGRNPALLALSYLGAERTLPNYNTMGLAKASLEAATRYPRFLPRPARHPRQRHLRRPDQDPGRVRHRQLLAPARLQRPQRPPAPQHHHRRSRQRRRLHAFRPGQRHHRRDHVRRWRAEYDGAG